MLVKASVSVSRLAIDLVIRCRYALLYVLRTVRSEHGGWTPVRLCALSQGPRLRHRSEMPPLGAVGIPVQDMIRLRGGPLS